MLLRLSEAQEIVDKTTRFCSIVWDIAIDRCRYYSDEIISDFLLVYESAKMWTHFGTILFRYV